MGVVGRPPAHRSDIVLFEHIEHLQDCKTLSVGGDLPDIVSSVVGRDGSDPFIGMVFEIRFGEVPACFLAELDDLFGDGTLIKVLRSVLCDLAIGMCQAGVSKKIASLGRFFPSSKKVSWETFQGSKDCWALDQ